MKAYKFLLMGFALMICNLLYAQVSKEEAHRVVKENVLNNDFQSKNIFVSQTLISPLDTIKNLINEIVSPNDETWFFFIDDIPFANWAHDCRYVFVSAIDGSVVIHNDMFPPSLEMDRLHQVLIDTSFQTERFVIEKTRNFCTSENNYAIIISGGGEKYINYESYWNDCAAMYSILVNKYYYDKSKIYVIMSDGTDPAHDMTLINGTTQSSILD